MNQVRPKHQLWTQRSLWLEGSPRRDPSSTDLRSGSIESGRLTVVAPHVTDPEIDVDIITNKIITRSVPIPIVETIGGRSRTQVVTRRRRIRTSGTELGRIIKDSTGQSRILSSGCTTKSLAIFGTGNPTPFGRRNGERRKGRWRGWRSSLEFGGARRRGDRLWVREMGQTCLPSGRYHRSCTGWKFRGPWDGRVVCFCHSRGGLDDTGRPCSERAPAWLRERKCHFRSSQASASSRSSPLRRRPLRQLLGSRCNPCYQGPVMDSREVRGRLPDEGGESCLEESPEGRKGALGNSPSPAACHASQEGITREDGERSSQEAPPLPRRQRLATERQRTTM